MTIITALVMLITGYCLCETRHQLRKMKAQEDADGGAA